MASDNKRARDASSEEGAVQISCHFDSGNIEVVDASSPYGKGIILHVRKDVYTELEKTAHSQWFHFKASGGQPGAKFVIANANKCSFPSAWPGTTVCYSVDRVDWKRAKDTTYDEKAGTLAWTWPSSAVGAGLIYFAYFAPYSWERHQDVVARAATSPFCSAKILGQSLDGRDIDLLRIGRGQTKAWYIHRQHPGESQAEWFAEGLLEKLLDPDDAIAHLIREQCTVYVVPNMNPDGSVRGHLRTNACGANLNREWTTTGDYVAPTMHRSPEVFLVLAEMDRTGVDFFVDVHGDEEIPMNFIAGMEGIPEWGPRLQALQGAFVNAFERANPDFQTKIAYEPPPPGKGNLAICSEQVSHRFDCLGLTLEQPFKDNATIPDAERGWSPSKAKKLGASSLSALLHVRPYLRDATNFWETMDARDAYVRPLEGSSHSTLEARAHGNTFGTDEDIREADRQLATAESAIAELKVKRARLLEPK